MIKNGTIKQGEIYMVNFEPSVGHEYRSIRPALVVQSGPAITRSNLVTVMPFTSNTKNRMQGDILVQKDAFNNLFVDSILKVYCIVSFDYLRFIKRVGEIQSNIMEEVKLYLIKHFGL